jgi:hypothetical protein
MTKTVNQVSRDPSKQPPILSGYEYEINLFTTVTDLTVVVSGRPL